MTGNETTPSDQARIGQLRSALFAVGLAVSVVMAFRAQMEVDQYVLIVRGWMFAHEGWLVPFGAFTAAGGFQPGALTSFMMGLPLLIWDDYRAIGLLTIATHVLAYWLLDRSLKEVLGSRGRLLLCIVYWLNPWRVFYSAHVWNPNLIFLPAVLHLSSAFELRNRRSFRWTFLHVLAIGIAFHLHASFVILAVASLALYARGFLKVNWAGFSAGVAVVSASLVTWLLAAMRYPGIIPINRGTLGSGLFQMVAVLEGAVYWLRYSAAAFSSKMTRFDFGPALGEGWSEVLEPVFFVLVRVIGPITLLLVLRANIWLWKRPWTQLFGRVSSRTSDLDWILGYCRWIFIALALALALNPASNSSPGAAAGTTSWRGFIALHAAVLPALFWLLHEWQTAAMSKVRLGVGCYAAGLILTLGAMSIAAPMYRKGGEDHLKSVIRERHQMLDELGINEGASVVIDPENGFASELLDGLESLERPAPFPIM